MRRNRAPVYLVMRLLRITRLASRAPLRLKSSRMCDSMGYSERYTMRRGPESANLRFDGLLAVLRGRNPCNRALCPVANPASTPCGRVCLPRPAQANAFTLPAHPCAALSIARLRLGSFPGALRFDSPGAVPPHGLGVCGYAANSSR